MYDITSSVIYKTPQNFILEIDFHVLELYSPIISADQQDCCNAFQPNPWKGTKTQLTIHIMIVIKMSIPKDKHAMIISLSAAFL